MKSSVGVLFLILGLVGAVLLVVNVRYARANPGGTDFLVHWVAARRVLFQGESPYSENVALEIQRRIYGRPARPGEHEQRVVYPLYSVVLFAPFAMVPDFPLARAIWMTVLELALVGTLGLGLWLVDWSPDRWTLGLLAVFSVTWYHGVRAVINGNAVVLVTLFLVFVAFALRKQQDEAAGLFLALATIKPNLALLPFLFVVAWGISRRRWRLVGFAIGGWLALVIGATWWRPTWWIEYIRELMRFPSYNPPGTVQAVFRLWIPSGGGALSVALSAVLGGLLLWFWWRAWGEEDVWFLWVFNLTLVVSQWIGIQTDPGNFVLLFLPLLHVWALCVRRWPSWGIWIVRLTLMALWAGLWVLFLRTLTFVNGVPLQSPWMLFPTPAFALVGLLWLYWWAVYPSRWSDHVAA